MFIKITGDEKKIKTKRIKLNSKYTLPILTMLLFTYVFLLDWFWDELFSLLFAVLFVPLIIIPILLLINIVRIITYIKNNCKSFSGYLSLTIFLILILTIVYFHPSDMRDNFEYNTYYDIRNQAVKDISNGKLKISEYNIVNLPKKYEKTSRNKIAKVYLNSAEDTLIGFYLACAFYENYSQIIYSSGGEELIKNNINNIYEIEQKNENWFFVYFD